MSSLRQQLSIQLFDSSFGPFVRGVKSRILREEHRLLFFCNGASGEWSGMGQQLYATEPVFRETIERCSEVVEKHSGFEIVSHFSKGFFSKSSSGKAGNRLQDITTVLLTALQIAQCDLWRSRGIVPDGVVSMGLGECVAGYVAGALCREDAMRVACAWHEVMLSPTLPGQLLFVDCNYHTIRKLRQRAPVDSEIFGEFSPFCTLLWVADSDTPKMQDFLESEKTTYRAQSHQWACHSSHSSFALKKMERALAGLRPQLASLPVYSALLGSRVPAETRMDWLFWYGVLRQQCRLGDALQSALRDDYDTLVNIGADLTAAFWIEQNRQFVGRPLLVVDSMRRDAEEKTTWRQAEKALNARSFGTRGRGNGTETVGRRALVGDTVTQQDFNRATQQFMRDPYPYYEKLLEQGNVHHFEREGFWLVLGYEAVVKILKLPDEFFSFPLSDGDVILAGGEIMEDVHVRRAVSSYFSTHRVQSASCSAHSIARELLQKARNREDFDVVSEFAFPLSMRILGHFLDMSEEKMDILCQRTLHFFHDMDSMTRILRQFFQEYAEEVRRNPGVDFCSQLVKGGGERQFSAEEVSGVMSLIWIAGTHTMNTLIPEAILLLAAHRDVREEIQADQNLIAPFVEETLRLSSPSHNLPRLLKEDLTISGVTLPAGALVKLCLGAANRDREQWPDPHRISLHRDTRGGVMFGHGIHRCIGAALARVEVHAALSALFEEMPNFRSAEPPYAVHWNKCVDNRGLESFLIAAE